MSLKAFHIIFVTASIAVSLFLGIWSFMSYRDTHARADLIYVICSAIAVIALLWYGKYFLKKLKHISYL
jgi:uncharacterized membrane protein YcjF (UPF0283 family)